MIEETQEFKGRLSVDRRFFITSLSANARQIAQAVRAYWAMDTGRSINRAQGPCAAEHSHRAPCGAQHGEHCEVILKGIGVKVLRKKSRLG